MSTAVLPTADPTQKRSCPESSSRCPRSDHQEGINFPMAIGTTVSEAPSTGQPLPPALRKRTPKSPKTLKETPERSATKGAKAKLQARRELRIERLVRSSGLELQSAIIRRTGEASRYSHQDESASPLELLRYALTAGAQVRRGPAGALEAIAAYVAVVRLATDRLIDTCRNDYSEEQAETQECAEIIVRNLTAIEAQARAAAKWFSAGGK